MIVISITDSVCNVSGEFQYFTGGKKTIHSPSWAYNVKIYIWINNKHNYSFEYDTLY